VSSGGVGNVYDFENHLIQQGGVKIVYDGDGNRVFKTVAGFTTGYLVDDRNPTGYVQVLDEVQSPQISRAYVYGVEMIEQDAVNTFNLQVHTSYNVYDGHGSVRALTNLSGAVTETYDYDAFGNLIHSTGSTGNVYLYSGEQFDPDLHLTSDRTRRLWPVDYQKQSIWCRSRRVGFETSSVGALRRKPSLPNASRDSGFSLRSVDSRSKIHKHDGVVGCLPTHPRNAPSADFWQPMRSVVRLVIDSS
jgi:YD repeat-containing protein